MSLMSAQTEHEARDRAAELIASKRWPCYFFKSDTSGEKDFEEFFTESEILDMDRFINLGVIKNRDIYSIMLDHFIEGESTWSGQQFGKKHR